MFFFSSCQERRSKRNQISDLRIPRSDALPLSHRDFTVSEVYYEIHMTRVLTVYLQDSLLTQSNNTSNPKLKRKENHEKVKIIVIEEEKHACSTAQV